MINTNRTKAFLDSIWDDEIVPILADYIRIPNKSPAFDQNWAEHGYMDQAVKLRENWAQQKLSSLPGSALDVIRLPGRTPVIVIRCARPG